MFAHLNLGDAKVIDLDYLLNIGRLNKATTALTVISIRLGEAYYKEQVALVQE